MTGSSPLARGTPRRDAQPWTSMIDRFIPARAGNTTILGQRTSSRYGSSPLARGTLRSTITTVHPRSRGEHTSTGPRWNAGSRFIPARAGNTSGVAPTSWPTRTVHPRSRGEHLIDQRTTIRCDGSSPLARGTLLTGKRPTFFGSSPSRGANTWLLRFIPARAGNTGCRCIGIASWRPVHPRSRGEHSSHKILIQKAFLNAENRTNPGRRIPERKRRLDLGGLLLDFGLSTVGR